MESIRVKGGALAAALVSGAVATGTLGVAPSANASCFSIFGIGNGNGCTSNLTSFAIGIGEGAVAEASTNYFGGAIAFGNNASVSTAYSAFTLASALGNNASVSSILSIFSLLKQLGTGATSVIGGPNIAIGVGSGAGAQATNVIGGFNIIAQLGPGTASVLGGTNFVVGAGGGNVSVAGLGNIAGQLGPGSTQVIGGLNLGLGVSPWGNGAQTTLAGLLGTVALNILGDGNVATQGFFGGAVNLFGTSDVEMAGIFATALNILGNGNTVSVLPGALLSVAAGLLSNNITLTSGPGPLSLAAAIFQNGVTIGQALGSAIEDITAPITSAASATSRAIADAMSAASAGDLVGAFTALAKLPGAVLDAFLFGSDADTVGPEEPLPGLLSVKDPDCTTQCHDGGPLYQFFVGLPAAINTAIANIADAAGSVDPESTAPESGDTPEVAVTEGVSESDSAATTLVSTVSPDPEGTDDAEAPAEDTEVPAVGAESVSQDSGAITADDTSEAEVAEIEADVEIDVEIDDEIDDTTDTSDDTVSDDNASAPAKHAKSPGATTAGAENTEDTEDAQEDASDQSDDSASSSSADTGSSSKSGGKHRAGPRHAK